MAQYQRSMLLIVFCMFAVLFNFPILHIVDSHKMIVGIPVLYFYLFFVWFLLISATVFVVLRRNK